MGRKSSFRCFSCKIPKKNYKSEVFLWSFYFISSFYVLSTIFSWKLNPPFAPASSLGPFPHPDVSWMWVFSPSQRPSGAFSSASQQGCEVSHKPPPQEGETLSFTATNALKPNCRVLKSACFCSAAAFRDLEAISCYIAWLYIPVLCNRKIAIICLHGPGTALVISVFHCYVGVFKGFSECFVKVDP